jgi:hypothetical protein
MLKCLFVDLTSISSTKPKSKFNKAQIEKLADSILAIDGLVNPLILSQTGSENGVDRYTIIEGDLAYYAALRAKEKDLRKAEMVNAFVIPADCQQAAIEQLTLLAKTKSTVVEPEPQSVETVEETTRDELFERLSAEIARQLAPLSQKIDTFATIVDRHDRMLAELQPPTAVITPPVEPAPKAEPIVPSTVKKVTESKKTSTTTTQKKAKQQPEQLPEVPPVQTIAPKELTASVTPAKKSTTKKTTTPKNPAKSDPFAGIDPEKLARTLQLVNTSNLSELTLMMSRSGIASVKTLATNLIAKRDTQPDRIFQSWQEIVTTKVAKLTQKTAVEIVNKLK